MPNSKMKGVKMLDRSMLKLVNALTTEDVKEMASLGLEDKLGELLRAMDDLALAWRNRGLVADSKAWDDVNAKIGKLRDARREAK